MGGRAFGAEASDVCLQARVGEPEVTESCSSFA